MAPRLSHPWHRPRGPPAAPQVLASREQYCVNKSVRESLRQNRGGGRGGAAAGGGASLNEECKNLLESQSGCIYHANFNRILTHRDGPASGRPMDIEDLSKLGAKARRKNGVESHTATTHNAPSSLLLWDATGA